MDKNIMRDILENIADDYEKQIAQTFLGKEEAHLQREMLTEFFATKQVELFEALFKGNME